MSPPQAEEVCSIHIWGGYESKAYMMDQNFFAVISLYFYYYYSAELASLSKLGTSASSQYFRSSTSAQHTVLEGFQHTVRSMRRADGPYPC